jgi:transaldolase
MRVLTEREVVDDVISERTEITEKDARRYVPTAKMGDVVRVPNTPNSLDASPRRPPSR